MIITSAYIAISFVLKYLMESTEHNGKLKIKMILNYGEEWLNPKSGVP